MIYIDLTERPKGILMGLKINKSTLEEKKVTIEEVANLLLLTEKYVIGYDVNLSDTQQPHYHIHFTYYGKIDAIQKLKQRKLKDYGKTTKLYQAKDKEDSNPYSWYGYAIKENKIYASPDLDESMLNIESHTMYEFKKSQLKHGKKIEDKKLKKISTEEKVFLKLDEETKQRISFEELMSKTLEIYLAEHNQMLSIQRIEYLTYKYLLIRGKIPYKTYVSNKYHNIKDNFNV